jgi:3-oxoacyl-[acyl-carrier-protein] synthase II
MGKRRVVVTGLGVLAPNGIGTREFWQATLDGKSGIEAITAWDASTFETRIAGFVKDFDPLQWLPRDIARRVDRYALLGLVAAKMAIEDSGLDLAREDRERAGVIFGSGLGGLLFHEEQIVIAYAKGPHRVNPLCVPRICPNAVGAHISILYGLMGPNFVISTACASGSHGLGQALRAIQHGEADIVISGGAEAPLTRFTFGAYSAMRVMSRRNDAPQKASRPFDRQRDGFVIAEGAGCLVLEELGHAVGRGARIYAELAGYGATSGAFHMVIPEPSGHDAARAIALALRDAELRPQDIDYINAHGTATQQNDKCETLAIKEVFGDFARQVPVSSTKSVTGHTIGAAGGIEGAVCCLAIRDGKIPPTMNYEDPDPECDLDFVPNVCRERKVDVALSNSFGFGSTNACLVFRKYST